MTDPVPTPPSRNKDFVDALKQELDEVLSDIRSIKAYMAWRRPKLDIARDRRATLKALIDNYEREAVL